MPNDPKFEKDYQKHLKYLKLNGLRPKTIEAYCRAIRRIGNYFNCRIYNLSSDQLLDYFNELLDSHSWSAVKLDLYGLKFFYTNVLGKPWINLPLVKPPKTKRIPDILSSKEKNRTGQENNTKKSKNLATTNFRQWFCIIFYIVE
jgi:site-specific recombinase XerD